LLLCCFVPGNFCTDWRLIAYIKNIYEQPITYYSKCSKCDSMSITYSENIVVRKFIGTINPLVPEFSFKF
jgi:hypothetical protein